MMDEQNILEYERTVEAYAKEGTDFLFHNQGNKHALIVFKSIFKNAKSTIRIAAGSLDNSEVANSTQYIDALQEYLNRDDSKLYVLLSNPVNHPTDLPLFKMLKEHRAFQEGRIELKDGKGKNFKRDGNIFHFCVADDRMYRIESDIENRAAECNFGDVAMTDFLTGLYTKAFDSVSDVYNL